MRRDILTRDAALEEEYSEQAIKVMYRGSQMKATCSLFSQLLTCVMPGD